VCRKLLFVGLVTCVGCNLSIVGVSTLTPGAYSADFAEVYAAGRWQNPPAQWSGSLLRRTVTIGPEGFPMIGGEQISAGMTLEVSLGNILLTEKIQQVRGNGTMVSVAYSGTILQDGVTSQMSGGYILIGGTSSGDLSFTETIYVGTKIPDEAFASRVVKFEGTLWP
jgi:hypothetical protein